MSNKDRTRQDKERKWPQVAPGQVGNWENFFPERVYSALAQLLREEVESPSLEGFGSCVDVAPGGLGSAGGVGPDGPGGLFQTKPQVQLWDSVDSSFLTTHGCHVYSPMNTSHKAHGGKRTFSFS